MQPIFRSICRACIVVLLASIASFSRPSSVFWQTLEKENLAADSCTKRPSNEEIQTRGNLQRGHLGLLYATLTITLVGTVDVQMSGLTVCPVWDFPHSSYHSHVREEDHHTFCLSLRHWAHLEYDSFLLALGMSARQRGKWSRF